MTRKEAVWRARAYLYPVLLFTLALSVMRAYLFLRYPQFFIAGNSDVALAFARGVRFDIATAFTISLPFIILSAAPGAARAGRLIIYLLWGLLAWQCGLLVYQFIDIHFYADTQRRLSYDILYAWQSVEVVMKMGFTGFMAESVAMIAALGAYALIYWKFVIGKLGAPPKAEPGADGAGLAARAGKAAGTFLLFAALTVLCIRGGFQFKPLGVSHAFLSANEAMGNLSLNGIYTTFQALYDYQREGGAVSAGSPLSKEEKDLAASMITSPEEIVPDPAYPLYRRFDKSPEELKRLNVVLIIMESWTGKYLKSLGGQISGGPFFDRLAEDSLSLTNCFANSQRTFEGAMSVIGSFPTWNPILTGASGLSYQTRLKPAGSVFSSMGYETIFIHGGEKDSMGFHKLIKRFGFSRHISLGDFVRNQENYDGIWGIYDKAAFERAHEEFTKINKPFFAVVLSLSSHLPFRLPSEEFAKYNDYDPPMSDFLNSMGYSDYALEEFFKLAKGSDYYQNTLFVITADHTARYFSNHNMRESYQIPCLFHAPALGLKGRMDTLATQYDLIPSILDIAGSNAPFTAWGKSVFAGGPRGAALPRDSQSRVFISDGSMLLATHDQVMGLFDMATGARKDHEDKDREEAAKLHKMMRAYIGFSERLIMDNKVSPP